MNDENKITFCGKEFGKNRPPLIIAKSAFLLINFLLILVLGEWLFPKFLGKLPLRLYGSIDKNLRILAQGSKKSLLPNEYIAIVGDSVAVGSGDWLEEVSKNSFFGSPDYSPAHLIHKKTGIDVVSFGQAGVGSFGGIWREPITQFKHINSVRDYQLSPPKYILIFFSEGGDIYENIQFLSGYAQAEKKRIQNFLNSKFEKVLNQNFSKNFWENMLFTQFFFQGISNLVKQQAKPRNEKRIYPNTPNNIALIASKNVQLKNHLVGPPLFGIRSFEKKFGLTKESLKNSLYVFEQSLVRLATFFSPSRNKNSIYPIYFVFLQDDFFSCCLQRHVGMD